MRWPLLAPQSEIVECFGLSVQTHDFWRGFDRGHLCAGNELTLKLIQAFVGRSFEGSAYV